MNQPVVIVTGASRGLGAAIALELTKLRARVVLVARSHKRLQEIAQKINDLGGTALVIAGDLRQEDFCQTLPQQVADQWGQLDALIDNAGIIEPIAPIAEADITAWKENWAINFIAPVLLSRAAIPYLRQSEGRIINISSSASVNAIGGWAAYSTAKAALNLFTRILAVEEPKITALAIRPGVIDTEMQKVIRERGYQRMAKERYNYLTSLYHQGELLPPELPGRAIAHLALKAPRAWSGEFIQWNEERVFKLINAEA
jgi:NAD(P)-dependent dehydrogenase (short-subunit alcohol dehydrogenase family)